MTTILDIIIDYDDVLYPWSKTAHKVCVDAGITNGNEITQWEFWKDYGCTEAELWATLNAATLTGELYNARITPNTLNQLRRLRFAGHRVHIVTARGFGQHGELIQRLTREQISRENVPLDSLTFAKDKTVVKADFALDDGVHNYNDLTTAGVSTFLMNAPHNQHATGAVRVNSVEAFVDFILGPVPPEAMPEDITPWVEGMDEKLPADDLLVAA